MINIAFAINLHLVLCVLFAFKVLFSFIFETIEKIEIS